jgi:hypothetical protein
VSGSVALPWWGTLIGPILRSFMLTTVATTVTTGVYDHGLLFDDASSVLGLSIQQQYTSAVAINALSAVVNQMTITAAQKAAVQIGLDLIAKDEAKAGGTWDYDGTTGSPAVLGTPSYPTILRPLMFYDAAVTINGTPSLNGSTKKISVAGGTAYPKVDNVVITIANNLDAEGFALASPDPTVQELYPGDRDITVSFDISWSDYATTFYDAARAGTAMAFVLDIIGPTIAAANKHEAHIIIPSLFFDVTKLPPLEGPQSRKKRTVTGKAQLDSVTGVDFGIWIRSSEATL